MSQATVQRTGFGFDFESLTAVHWVGMVLAAITGVVHLFLFYDQGFVPFLLAGLGFFGGIALLLVTQGRYRLGIYLVGIPFTAAQIAGYVAVEQPRTLGDVTTLAIVDKVVQVVLIALLAYLFVTEWRR